MNKLWKLNIIEYVIMRAVLKVLGKKLSLCDLLYIEKCIYCNYFETTLSMTNFPIEII